MAESYGFCLVCRQLSAGQVPMTWVFRFKDGIHLLLDHYSQELFSILTGQTYDVPKAT